jgi:glycosyltransferase involved in cell wall biosynthesis
LPGLFYDHLYVSKYLKDIDLYFSPVNILPAHKKEGTRYAVGVLDLCTFIVPETTTLSLKTYYDLFLKASLKRADQVITISENTRRDLIRLFDVPKSIVNAVPLGIDQKTIYKETNRKQTVIILKRFNLSIDTPFFLAVGSSPRKNMENTIKANELNKKKYKTNEKLIIVVGDNKMIHYIESLTACLKFKDDIYITKRYISNKELSVLYSNAVALLYCSYYEGFGLPVLESMKNGCPVIASNNSSLPEIIENSGLLIDPYNINSISSAMRTMSTDSHKRKLFIQTGHKIAKKYTWTAAAKSILTIFKTELS